MSQKDRVLTELVRSGEYGVTAYQFATSPPDGGPRIMRVAARVGELRDDGHVIVDGGVRDGHKVYALCAATPKPVRVLEGDGEATSLFPRPSNAIYGHDQ